MKSQNSFKKLLQKAVLKSFHLVFQKFSNTKFGKIKINLAKFQKHKLKIQTKIQVKIQI